MRLPLRSLRFPALVAALAIAALPEARAHPPVEVPIAELSRRIALEPDRLGLYLARGELRRIQGDRAGARADLARVGERAPGYEGLAHALAALALDAGDPGEARRLLDAELAARPGEPGALRLRARAWIALGDRRAAIADLGAALAGIERPEPDLYLERARLQVETGDREGARVGLDEARARLGPLVSLEPFAIDLELADGRPAAARERYERLRVALPDEGLLAGLGARIAAADRGAGAPRARSADPPPRAQGILGPPAATPAARSATAAVPQLTRGPYLQLATSEGVTVRWRTSEAAESVVRYGPNPDRLPGLAAGTGLATEHEVRLSDLAPDTRYYYSVGTADDVLAGDASHTFRTAPPPGTVAPTRLWVIGDSGQPGFYAQAVRDAYADWTGPRGTDLWLMLGDNAYSSGSDSEYQAAVFNQYPLMLRQVPVWPTRGNHDILRIGASNDYYDFFTLPAGGEAGGVASGTEAYYSFDWGHVHFVCLDSEGSSRAPGSAMLTWLASDLAANTRPWVIAYWHHPPYSKGSHDSDTERPLIEMRQNALPILEAGGADLVLTGHSHSYERSYLLDGHYGNSLTLTRAMVLDRGDGRPGGDGPYRKPGSGPTGNAGAVYAVAGSSSKVSGGPLDHIVMVTSLNLWGSMVLDVDGGRLDARFLGHTGVVLDSFAIVKPPVAGVGMRPAPPGEIRLGPALPNPFTLDLRLTYALEHAGHMRLAIHDSAGRRVAVAAAGRRQAGVHEARWDGRDRDGRLLPTGVYLAVLEVGGTRVSRKLALVR